MPLSKTLTGAAIRGGLGFGLMSLIVFASVAFGERWMYRTLGVLGAYVVWTVAFILLGGVVFGSMVQGSRWRLPRFYLLWALAFFAYAAGWVAAYFSVGGAAGEWLGSLGWSTLVGVGVL